MEIGVPGSRAVLAAVVVAVVLLPGCANDAQLTRTQGAAAGAVLGGVAGRVIGGNKDSAIVGGVLGGVAGAVYGDQVADQKARYAAREDAMLASAARATALAQASRDQNQQLKREIAALDRSVQRLQLAKMSAESKRASALQNQQKLQTLLASVDDQLRQLREETARQSALLNADAAGGAPPSTQGARMMATSMRSMDEQTRTLELAKANLQKIDQRRAY